MTSHLDLSAMALMRVRLGLTQQQLANSLGFSRSALAMAETGRRPMPAFALPILKEMMAIAKKMPAPQAGYSNRRNRISKRSNNRVEEAARLHTLIKKPFVTAQRLVTTSYALPALTQYRSGSSQGPAYSTHLLQSDAACKQLIGRCTVKKERKRYQVAYLQLETRIAVNRDKEIKAQLAYVNTMIQSNLEIMHQFPAGKRKLEHRNARLYCKKLQLEDLLAHFDAGAMVLREHTINVMVKQLKVLQRLIDSVENKKLEMQDQLGVTIIKGSVLPFTDVTDMNLLQQRA